MQAVASINASEYIKSTQCSEPDIYCIAGHGREISSNTQNEMVTKRSISNFAQARYCWKHISQVKWGTKGLFNGVPPNKFLSLSNISLHSPLVVGVISLLLMPSFQPYLLKYNRPRTDLLEDAKRVWLGDYLPKITSRPTFVSTPSLHFTKVMPVPCSEFQSFVGPCNRKHLKHCPQQVIPYIRADLRFPKFESYSHPHRPARQDTGSGRGTLHKSLFAQKCRMAAQSHYWFWYFDDKGVFHLKMSAHLSCT